MADDFARQLLDALYNPETQPPQQPSRPLREKLAGAAETAATIGTGLLASVPAGLAGLTQLIPTRGHRPSVNRAAQKVEDVQSALTYLPRTEAGQEYLEKTAGALGVLGMPAEFLGEQTLKLTGSPFLATAANVGLDPVNYIGMPGSGKAAVATGKALGRAAAAAPRVAGEMAQDLLMGRGRMEGQRGAIKMKGGNWLAGEVEGATDPLKRPTVPQEFAEEFGGAVGNRTQMALNNWIDKKLSRYIKNEMATPEDPVRKLAERGISHMQGMEQHEGYVGIGLKERRKAAGLPEQGFGESRLAKNWETKADQAIYPRKAGELSDPNQWFAESAPDFQKQLEANPWLAKVPPETPVFETASTAENFDRMLGFDHLIDELKNALDPNSDLPARLRYKPEDLEKVTMEQAVRRVHDINQYRAQKKAEANEVLARNPATVTFKEYPAVPGSEKPNEKGLAWKEIKAPDMPAQLPEGWTMLEPKGDLIRASSPDGATVIGDDIPDLIKNIYRRHPETPGNPRTALEEALKYEGDVMGHCVGGYCDDVMLGRSQIYSLRDKKGEPHVTIEVERMPRRGFGPGEGPKTQPEDQALRYEWLEDVKSGKIGDDVTFAEWWRSKNGIPEPGPEFQITQIKGKGNKAPKEEYLPFVQDFVRNGNWSRVGDFQNTGLRDIDRTPKLKDWLRSKNIETPKYLTEQEYGKYEADFLLDQLGKKEGGSVHISDNPDTMALELQVGGAVKAAKAAAKAAEKKALSVPYDIPRAPAKSKEEIQAIAERMARQMTDEFVRPDPKKSKNVSGKTFDQFKREKELESEYVTRPTKDVTPPEVADIEKQKGMVKFGIPGDTTIANQELVQAGPYRLESPAPQHGGPMFPLGGEGAWASNNPIAKNVQTRIGEMSEFFDAPVLGQYMSMGPSGSMFAQHLADANLQAIDLSKMTKRQVEQFNKLLREGNEKTGPRESFPGIQDKGDAYLYLSVDPKLRIYFNQLMQMPSVTGPLGLPDGRVILDAITEPELRNKEIMTSGLSQFEFDPSVKPKQIPMSMHPTYSHLIPMREGAPVTRTRYPTPAELEFPDVTKFIRENYRPSEFTPTFQKASPRQKIDQQAIDEIKMYEEMMKSLTGKKKGGAVKMQAGGALKAAVKAAKPTAEQAAKMAEQRAELVLRSRAMQELKDQFENLPQPPKGFLSSESILQRMDEIRRREATPPNGQIPLLKKGGKVKFTDNLDTMRLAVQKRK